MLPHSSTEYKHIYVWQIGVKHDEMQRGYGSQLMREITTYADENNLPIYLESSKDVNLPFYRKHGFVGLERKQVMSTFPFYWRLLRPTKNPLLPFGQVPSWTVCWKKDERHP